MWLFYAQVSVLQEIYIVVEYSLRNLAFLHTSKRTAGDIYFYGTFVKKCGFSTLKWMYCRRYIFLWDICYEIRLFYTQVNVLQEIYTVVEYSLWNLAFLHLSECTAGDIYFCGIFVMKCGFSTHKWMYCRIYILLWNIC